MSRRTYEASKAITAAWVKEKLLVDEGKGTRDWTPDQQTDIQNKGKAYDENGKAYQGHHMKSAEAYPEYQGDADNIQFLTASEHSAAHNNGNYSIPTNGCFDPATGITKDFGSNTYEPCKVIELNNPVTIKRDSQKSDNNVVQEAEITASGNGTRSQPYSDKLPRKNSDSIKVVPKSFPERIKRFIVTKATSFGIETRADLGRAVLRGTFKAAIFVAPIVIDEVAKALSDGQRESDSDSYDYSNDDEYQTDDDMYGESESSPTNYNDRSSPIEHNVRPHSVPPYTKKDGTKVSGYHRGGEDGYSRGGKKTED